MSCRFYAINAGVMHSLLSMILGPGEKLGVGGADTALASVNKEKGRMHKSSLSPTGSARQRDPPAFLLFLTFSSDFFSYSFLECLVPCLFLFFFFFSRRSCFEHLGGNIRVGNNTFLMT